MLKIYFSFYLISLVAFSGCQSSSSANDSSPASTVQSINSLPALPAAEINRMRAECSGIDYTFLDPSFSMSVDDPEEFMQDFDFIGLESPGIDPACKPIAMVFYKTGTDRFFDAELYLNERCNYLIFTKNGERLYANALSDVGIENFNAIVNYIRNEMQNPPAGQ
jgi:hypothetical protein